MIDTKTAIEKITNGEFDNLFTDIYIDSSMIDYQKKRYVHAIEQYETIFCPDKVAIFSAPGRSEVCGNHTDHQHGMVLATSINLDTIAVRSRRRCRRPGFVPGREPSTGFSDREPCCPSGTPSWRYAFLPRGTRNSSCPTRCSGDCCALRSEGVSVFFQIQEISA